MTTLAVLKQKLRKYFHLLKSHQKKSPILNQYYFGYGANVREERYRENGMAFHFLGPAKIENYQLQFNLPTNRKGLGYSSISKKKGRDIWGTLVRIDKTSLLHLDILEWVNYGYYQRIKVPVTTPSGKSIDAWAYQGCIQKEGLIPSTEYLSAMTTIGKELNYSKAYIKFLENQPHKPFADFQPDLRFNPENPTTPRYLPKRLEPLARMDFLLGRKLMQFIP